MLRIAIVGCGKIADAHAIQIRRIAGCEIVGACDREGLMAQQLAERFEVGAYFDDVSRLLAVARPDVVHITTPPQSHFPIAQQCLDAGAHVYVEKPFTIDAREAEELIGLAERRGLKVSVGHDAQFSPAAQRLRALMRDGVAGAPVHLESHYGYDLANPTYARAFLGDRDHWLRKLPGGLLQNVISHGIARIAEFLSGDHAQVVAHAFVSERLRSLGYDDVLDELRVIVTDDRHCTAYFTFSSSMRPLVHQFRVLGSRNGLVLDEHQQTVLTLRGRAFKSYAERFVPPVVFAGQYLANLAHNGRLFLTNEFHMDAGKRALMAAFYRSIAEGTPLPISTREILLTARIMDAIFEQVGKSFSPARREVSPC